MIECLHNIYREPYIEQTTPALLLRKKSFGEKKKLTYKLVLDSKKKISLEKIIIKQEGYFLFLFNLFSLSENINKKKNYNLAKLKAMFITVSPKCLLIRIKINDLEFKLTDFT